MFRDSLQQHASQTVEAAITRVSASSSHRHSTTCLQCFPPEAANHYQHWIKRSSHKVGVDILLISMSNILGLLCTARAWYSVIISYMYIYIHIYLYFFRMLLISYFVHKLLQHFTQLCTYSLSCDGPGPSIPMRLSAFRAFALDRGSASLRSRNHGKNAERNIWKKVHEKMWKSIERWGNVRCIVMLAELISGENQSYVTPFIARFIACLHSKIFPDTWPACRHFLCRQA